MSHFGNLTKNAENRRFDGKNEIFHLFGMELETNSFIRKTHCEQTDENEEQERLERANGQNVGDLLELPKKKNWPDAAMRKNTNQVKFAPN